MLQINRNKGAISVREYFHNGLMRFCASSSEVPGSPSQRQDIDLRLGRSNDWNISGIFH